jgi:hypothetical protein
MSAGDGGASTTSSGFTTRMRYLSSDSGPELHHVLSCDITRSPRSAVQMT